MANSVWTKVMDQRTLPLLGLSRIKHKSLVSVVIDDYVEDESFCEPERQ